MFTIIAPSGPPTHFDVKAISSTSLNVSWSPPLPEHQNGVITNYTIIITDLDDENEIDYVILNHSLTVSSLDPHTAYGITVFAATSSGIGPQTDALTVHTHEDGKLTLLLTCIYRFIQLSPFLSTAPTHGPVNLTAIDTGPTYIHLTWSHPPDDTHQGIIRLYNIYTTEQETAQTFFDTTGANDTELYLRSLHPFYTYHIMVAAVTVKEGNSTTLSVRTDEAGTVMHEQCIRSIPMPFTTPAILCFHI